MKSLRGTFSWNEMKLKNQWNLSNKYQRILNIFIIADKNNYYNCYCLYLSMALESLLIIINNHWPRFQMISFHFLDWNHCREISPTISVKSLFDYKPCSQNLKDTQFTCEQWTTYNGLKFLDSNFLWAQKKNRFHFHHSDCFERPLDSASKMHSFKNKTTEHINHHTQHGYVSFLRKFSLHCYHWLVDAERSLSEK